MLVLGLQNTNTRWVSQVSLSSSRNSKQVSAHAGISVAPGAVYGSEAEPRFVRKSSVVHQSRPPGAKERQNEGYMSASSMESQLPGDETEDPRGKGLAHSPATCYQEGTEDTIFGAEEGLK